MGLEMEKPPPLKIQALLPNYQVIPIFPVIKLIGFIAVHALEKPTFEIGQTQERATIGVEQYS
jgi:hypothetical protein